MTRAVFLDLDGTLMRSDPGIIRSVLHVLEHMGLSAPQEYPTWLIGPTLDTSFVKLGVPEARVPEALDRYCARYDTEGFKEAEVYDGVLGALEQLKTAGYRMALATSKPRIVATDVVKHFGIAPYLDHVFGAEVEGHDTSKKENLLARGLAAFGMTAQACVMVGDRLYDVAGAKAHQMPVIGAAYGYGGAPELRTAGADRIIDHARDLPATVAELIQT